MKKGRPPKNGEPTGAISTRLPLSTISWLKKQAKAQDRSIAYVLRDIVKEAASR